MDETTRRPAGSRVLSLLLVTGLAAQLFLLLYVQEDRLQIALGVVTAAHLGVAWLTLRGQAAVAPQDMAASPTHTLKGSTQSPHDHQHEASPSGWSSSQSGRTGNTARSAPTWKIEALAALPGLESAAALRQLQGDEAAYVRSLQHFVQRYRDNIGHWVTWVDNNRWEDLERAAHQLQLHAGAVGARQLQAGALRLEMQVASEDALGAHACLPGLQDDLGQLVAALASHAAQQADSSKSRQHPA